MSSSRKHSTNKKGKANSYGHELRIFGITNGTFRTTSTMFAWADSHPWFNQKLFYHAPADKKSKRKGKQKAKVEMKAAIVGECARKMRRDIKPKLKIFIQNATGATSDEIFAVLKSNGRSFVPSVEELDNWSEKGYAFAQMIELITNRSVGMVEDLNLQAGKWQSVLSIHDGIGKGEIVYGDIDEYEDDDSHSDCDNNDNKEVEIVTKNRHRKRVDNKQHQNIDKRRGQKRSFQATENINEEPQRNKKRKLNHNTHSSYGSDSSNTNNNNNNNEKWRVENIKRGEYEGASNHHVKKRMGNKHPYYKRPKESRFMIYDFVPAGDPILKMPVVTSSTGDAWIYDTNSLHWAYDKNTLKRWMLATHPLKYMHRRMVPQHHMIQYTFINTRVPDYSIERLRVSGSAEYRIGCLISEYLQLSRRIEKEENAFIMNAKLIENEKHFRNEYLTGYSVPIEKACRLPRSKEYIERQQQQGKYTKVKTLWFFRNNILTLKDRLGEEEWDRIKKLWMIFGVLEWIYEYLVKFFPGNEQKAVDLGLLQKEDVDKGKGNILSNNNEEKEKMEDLEAWL